MTPIARFAEGLASSPAKADKVGTARTNGQVKSWTDELQLKEDGLP